MKALIRAIVVLPIAIFLVIFALANRTLVTVVLDPLELSDPPITLSAPLFFDLYFVLMLGILIGGIVTWISNGVYRRAVRLHQQEIERQCNELDALRQKNALLPLQSPTFVG